jgi:hypothetical protein
MYVLQHCRRSFYDEGRFASGRTRPFGSEWQVVIEEKSRTVTTDRNRPIADIASLNTRGDRLVKFSFGYPRVEKSSLHVFIFFPLSVPSH